jgi:TPR repeat protein/transglutaminase-like putative cysteine protease
MTIRHRIASLAALGFAFVALPAATMAQGPRVATPPSHVDHDVLPGPADLTQPTPPRDTVERKAEFPGEDWVIQTDRSKVRFENDGTGERSASARVRVLTEAGVRRWGQLVESYDTAFDRFEFRDVQVIKPDGRRIVTEAAQALDVTPQVLAPFPVYGSVREKHLSVSDLRPGDVLDYEAVWTTHTPLAPGQFFSEGYFSHTQIALEEEIEIDLPRDRRIKIRTAAEPVITEENGRRVYRLTHSSTHTDEVEKARKLIRRLKSQPRPDVAFSTFLRWEDVGSWYQGLERDRRAPTPAIRAKSAELTARLGTDLEKVQAIYDYVSTQIRYVSLSLGQGEVQPHPAADTLANGYGDCKDKHTLLSALLAAVGIEARAALVSSMRELDPAVPYLQFNHIITAVRVGTETFWLDTTTEVAPFRWLAPNLRRKQTLVVPAEGDAQLVETPPLGATANERLVEVQGRVDEGGRLTGHWHESYRGDPEVPMRVAYRVAPREVWKHALEKMLGAAGEPGKPVEASDIRGGDPVATREPFTIDADCTIAKLVDWTAHPPILHLTLFGAVTRAAEAADLPLDEAGRLQLGGPSTSVWRTRVDLPQGWSAPPPKAEAITTDFAEYRSRYAFEGHTLLVEHSLTVKAADLPEERGKEVDEFNGRLLTEMRRAFPLQGTAVPETSTAGVPTLGLRARGLPDAEGSAPASTSPSGGLVVTLVHADGPAALAGLQKGDVIVALDGTPVHNEPELVAAMRRHTIGDSARVDVTRKGQAVGVDVRLADALSLLSKGCDGGDTQACTDLGKQYEAGDGVPRDQARSAELFTRGCEGGDAEGCTSLGFSHERGSGVAKDEARASQLYGRACDGGDPRGCSALGRLYNLGRSVAKDEARARALVEKACDGGDARGCTLLGLMREKGEGGAKDEAGAAVLFAKSCGAGDPLGCTFLGWLHTSGRGVPRDEVRAASLLQQACDAHEATGCTILGALYEHGYGVPMDQTRALALYEKGCGGGNAPGCTHLGTIYENGTGVAKDEARAAALYKRGCDGGDDVACSRVRDRTPAR